MYRGGHANFTGPRQQLIDGIIFGGPGIITLFSACQVLLFYMRRPCIYNDSIISAHLDLSIDT